MKLTLSSQIELTELNPDERSQIMNACTHPNPKYFEALKQGRYTGHIQKQITLFEEIPGGLSIPMGCLSLLNTAAAIIDDKRNLHLVTFTFVGVLRAYQRDFVSNALHHDGGVLVAATGSGKTVAGIAMAARLKQRCLILVKSADLAEQWRDAILIFTGLNAGQIGGGRNSQGDHFTIGLVQSLAKRDLSQMDYGLVIADECHNAPACQFYTVINGLNCKYKFGLSATPQRRDCLEFMIHAALGEIIAEIDEEQLTGKVLPVITQLIPRPFYGYPESWHDFITILVNDEARNALIISLAARQSKPVMILCSQIRHCELLTVMAADAGLTPLLIHGRLPDKLRKARVLQAQNARLIIGTSQLLGEGLNLPSCEILIFASPMSAVIDKAGDPAATPLIQSIGRIRRPCPGKTHATVLDIVDRCGFGIAAAKKRLQIYQLQGWDVQGELYEDEYDYDY
jgi:superfamily II DNA or RNA helicase